MKRTLLALLAAGCAQAGPAPAAGSPAAAAKTAAATAGGLDVGPVRDRLRLYTDAAAHTLALVEPDPEEPAPRELTLFWLDGGRFHQVPVVSASADGLKFEIGFDDARIPARPAGSIKREGGKTVLSCDGTEVALVPMPAADAQKLLGGATFVADHTRWQPVALGVLRDRYLYVDGGATKGSRDQYRIFEGTKGALRAIPVVEARWDERENVLTLKTDAGTLRVRRDESQEREYTLKPAWDGRKDDWSSLPRVENWRLIFEGLGLYPEGRSPTPCDPMLASTR
jgi:hypothetical protein